jgi:hypothetical protein
MTSLFEITSTCKGGGYRYCRTYPPHPKANVKGLYPLHRVLVENSIGRLLSRDEQVHHVNEDKDDNRVENLAIMTTAEHARLHARTVDLVSLVCPVCGRGFSVPASFARLRLKRTAAPKCSRQCAGTRPMAHSYRGGCRCAECTASHREQARRYAARNR